MVGAAVVLELKNMSISNLMGSGLIWKRIRLDSKGARLKGVLELILTRTYIAAPPHHIRKCV